MYKFRIWAHIVSKTHLSTPYLYMNMRGNYISFIYSSGTKRSIFLYRLHFNFPYFRPTMPYLCLQPIFISIWKGVSMPGCCISELKTRYKGMSEVYRLPVELRVWFASIRITFSFNFKKPQIMSSNSIWNHNIYFTVTRIFPTVPIYIHLVHSYKYEKHIIIFLI